MKTKLLCVALVSLLPQVAMADFCSILKRGHEGLSEQCRKTATANGTEFYGNWAILSVQGTSPKTGERGEYRTAMTPPVSGEWQVNGNVGRMFDFDETCFLGERIFSLSDGEDATSGVSPTRHVYVKLDGGPEVREDWIANDDSELIVPKGSVLNTGLANASKMTLTLPVYSIGGERIRDNTFNYELAGYTEASKALCR